MHHLYTASHSANSCSYCSPLIAVSPLLRRQIQGIISHLHLPSVHAFSIAQERQALLPRPRFHAAPPQPVPEPLSIATFSLSVLFPPSPFPRCCSCQFSRLKLCWETPNAHEARIGIRLGQSAPLLLDRSIISVAEGRPTRDNRVSTPRGSPRLFASLGRLADHRSTNRNVPPRRPDRRPRRSREPPRPTRLWVVRRRREASFIEASTPQQKGRPTLSTNPRTCPSAPSTERSGRHDDAAPPCSALDLFSLVCLT